MVETKELLLAAKWAAWMVFATVDSTVHTMVDKSVEQRAVEMDIYLADLKVYTMAVSMVVERVDSKVESWEIRLDYQTADMMVEWTVYSLAAS